MLQEIKPEIEINTTTGVTLSESAENAVQGILTERQLDGYGLRVFVAGSSCCGVQFGMALDNNIRDNDLTFTSGAVQVIVDNASIEYLQGATVDYINDPVRGAGFVVDSPVQVSGGSCNCGSGGHAHDEEGSGGCGCGGSCSCGGH